MASIAPRVSVPAAPAMPAKEDSFAVLKALGEASAVFIALTFIGGWSYLSSYFNDNPISSQGAKLSSIVTT